MRKIKIESGVQYLGNSKEITELPENCIFDKGKVGCGGTTMAIDSKSPYVIAVPFVSLVENKVNQHKEVFGVYGGVTTNEIREYISVTKCPKIMTTYDGLDKVTKAIGNPANYKLLVDEYHLLFMQYSFRESAVNSVLANFKKYKEYCFMTATQLEDEFILEELSDLEVVVAKWADVSEVNVNSVLCLNGVTNTVIDVVNSFMDGVNEGNAYFFVNSVDFIKTVVKECSLTDEHCNVIYSKYNKTNVGIDRGVLPDDKDGKIPTKKINFLTSTVFEGADIYDRDGKIFIISDSQKAHTLVDISTSFQQIAGRIRNSRFLNNITHYYTNTRYNNLSYDEFKALSLKEIEISKQVSNEYNNLSLEARSRMALTPNESYISFINDEYIFNGNLVKVDLYNFKVCKFLYKIRVNNLANELNKYGFINTEFIHNTETRISAGDLKVSFKEVVENIKLFYNIMFKDNAQENYLEAAFTKYTFLEEAITKLGFEAIEADNYVQTNIKRKLAALIDGNIKTKIYKMLKVYSDVTPGSFIPTSTLKKRFGSIYSELGLDKKAKGSDIEAYFHTNQISRRIDGKVIKGYEIKNPKLIIK